PESLCGIAITGALLTLFGGIYVTSGWWHPLALFASAGIGALVCFIATFLRFFADDFGILRKAYRAGQEQAQARIKALLQELDAERHAHAETEAKLRQVQKDLNPRTKHVSELHPASAKE